jgi:hypothetical protein
MFVSRDTVPFQRDPLQRSAMIPLFCVFQQFNICIIYLCKTFQVLHISVIYLPEYIIHICSSSHSSGTFVMCCTISNLATNFTKYQFQQWGRVNRWVGSGTPTHRVLRTWANFIFRSGLLRLHTAALSSPPTVWPLKRDRMHWLAIQSTGFKNCESGGSVLTVATLHCLVLP